MRVLLLAGTAEARRLAARLTDVSGVEVIASLAGATERPEALDVTTRIGGFGGVSAMAEWARENEIGAILDATHPFATQISRNAHEVATELGLEHVQVLRPAWVAEARDAWVDVPDMAAAAEALRPGQRVFLATGRTSLGEFEGREDCWFLARVINGQGAEFPLKNGRFTQGRPPFSVADEVGVLQEASIDVVVTKNAGGDSSKSKLIAARELGIPVLMIARPTVAGGAVVGTVEAAIEWVEGLRHG